MEESKNIFVLELSDYTTPMVVEDKRNDWVRYMQEDEGVSQYDWLIDRFHRSPTNNAIINNMSRLIYGRGLSALNASRKPSQYAAMRSLFSAEVLRATCQGTKLLGDHYFQCIYNKAHTKIEKVHFITANLVNPEKCNKDGEIEAYYYSDNWEDTKKFPPTRIPAFGTSKERIELLRIIPYSVGFKYFSPVDYQGCLPYTVLEEEIADYLINEVQNHFSGNKVVNFNNGEADSPEQKEQLARRVNQKLTGSHGQKVIVSFNTNVENRTTVEDIPLNDAPEHYAYLSKEAEQKILIGHNVTSPMLVGVVTDNQGFSSNADEIDVASRYFYNTTIKPFQDLIIEAIGKILAFNGVAGLDLYFKRLNLLESVEEDAQQQEEQTRLALGDQIDDFISEFGEDESEDWELIDSREVDYEHEHEFDAQLSEFETNLAKQDETFLRKAVKFATGIARPNSESSQDKEIEGLYFKVRYMYVGNQSPERGFCRQMMRASKVYRKEDIQRMEAQGINKSFGHKGEPYSIWLYKGGPECNHKWERRTYVSTKKKASIGSHKTSQISTNKARKFGYRPTNEKEVSMMPKDMPRNGHHPDYTG
jgi:hypothetical protein